MRYKITKALIFSTLISITASCGVKPDGRLPYVHDDFKSTPPGTTQITETLYIDRIPVTNMMYREFLTQLKTSWSLEKSKEMETYPSYGLDKELLFEPKKGDAVLFRRVTYTALDTMISKKLTLENYASLPLYNYHPAITMNKEKAELFCKWRTDMANAAYATQSKSRSQRAKYPARVLFRLPTKQEMADAQRILHKEKRFFLFQDQIYSYSGDYDLYKNMQLDNALTIYEMKEVASDGVYNPFMGRYLKYYDEADLQTGFRCICEVTP